MNYEQRLFFSKIGILNKKGKWQIKAGFTPQHISLISVSYTSTSLVMISFEFIARLMMVTWLWCLILSCRQGVCVCVCWTYCNVFVSSLQPGGVTLVQSLGAGPQVRPQHGTEIELCVFVPFVSICLHPKTQKLTPDTQTWHGHLKNQPL